MTMTTAQYLALLDTEPETLLFDLRAKALVAGRKLDTAQLEGLDPAAMLGKLQLMGALPKLDPDGDDLGQQVGLSLTFPIDEAFPDWFAGMIRETAACCQVPEAHAAYDARLALNALIGPAINYAIHDDWSRHCGLFLCIVAPTGTGKSRTSRQLMKPMYALQTDIAEAATPGIVRARVDTQTRKLECEQLERQLKELYGPPKKGQRAQPEAERDGDMEALKDRLTRLHCEDEEAALDMVEPTLWETDVTTEYLLRVLVENAGQIALIGVETPLFALLAGRYTQGVLENVEVFNDAYDGMPVSAGRMKRQKLSCDEPRLACSIGTQPTVLYNTNKSSTLLERGTLARFSFYEPPSLLGHRDMTLKTINPDVRDTYTRKLRELAEFYRGQPPRDGQPFERKTPVTFTFSEEAQGRFEKWRQLRETERQAGGRLRKLTGFQARIDDILPRTAAQLHVLWNGPDAPPFIAEETG